MMVAVIPVTMFICLLGLSSVVKEVHSAALASPCCGRGAAFVGGAIVGAAISRHRHRHHGGCGCNSCCGRKKRGIPEDLNADMIEHIHAKISEQDIDQCGLRLICELAQKVDHQMTGHEKLIMLPYSGIFNCTSEDSAFGVYDNAAWLGQQPQFECDTVYSTCGYSASQIMDALALENSYQESIIENTIEDLYMED